MVTDVRHHPQVEKALNRMRAMGLSVNIYSEDDNTAYIFITLDSVIKLINKQIKYPNTKTYIEDNYIVIKVWRNEKWK